jgi:CBS domain-containing protein
MVEDQGLRHLPVVEESRVVGNVRGRDLREYRLPLLDDVAYPDYADELLDRAVDEAMSPQVVSVPTGATLREAIDLMLAHRIGAVVVLDARTRQLAGVLSYVDVLEAVRAIL